MHYELKNLLDHAAHDCRHQEHPMIKNLTPIQLLLIAMATVLLLLAAFSFYLLQDPSAPLPFAPPPATRTYTPLPPSPAKTTTPTSTSIPTRQTSYTPFATLSTPNLETPSVVPNQSETALPGGTTPPGLPTSTATFSPSGTSPFTQTPTSASFTSSPTVTETLSAGEYGVTGRVIQNGTPVANVVVEFQDDVAPRQSTTDSSGHYRFTTLAPGTTFSLTFNQGDNPQLTPVLEITSFAWIEGTLPTGINIITLPDFEVSINLNGMIFELQTPVDGATFSAAVISSSNPLQFIWSLSNLGESYRVELGPNGSDESVWISGQQASTNIMWDGTLDDGTHISQGAYWWRVAVTKFPGNYVENIYTQKFDILFNP
jgi:hypothetical protein